MPPMGQPTGATQGARPGDTSETPQEYEIIVMATIALRRPAALGLGNTLDVFQKRVIEFLDIDGADPNEPQVLSVQGRRVVKDQEAYF